MSKLSSESSVAALLGAFFAVVILFSAQFFVPEQVLAGLLSAENANRPSSGYGPSSNRPSSGYGNTSSPSSGRPGGQYNTGSTNTTRSASNSGSYSSGSLSNYGNSNNSRPTGGYSQTVFGGGSNYRPTNTNSNPLSGGSARAALNAVRSNTGGIGSDRAASALSTRANNDIILANSQQMYLYGDPRNPALLPYSVPYNGGHLTVWVAPDGRPHPFYLPDNTRRIITLTPLPGGGYSIRYDTDQNLDPHEEGQPAPTWPSETPMSSISDYLRNVASYLSPVGSANARTMDPRGVVPPEVLLRSSQEEINNILNNLGRPAPSAQPSAPLDPSAIRRAAEARLDAQYRQIMDQNIRNRINGAFETIEFYEQQRQNLNSQNRAR